MGALIVKLALWRQNQENHKFVGSYATQRDHVSTKLKRIVIESGRDRHRVFLRTH